MCSDPKTADSLQLGDPMCALPNARDIENLFLQSPFRGAGNARTQVFSHDPAEIGQSRGQVLKSATKLSLSACFHWRCRGWAIMARQRGVVALLLLHIRAALR